MMLLLVHIPEQSSHSAEYMLDECECKRHCVQTAVSPTPHILSIDGTSVCEWLHAPGVTISWPYTV